MSLFTLPLAACQNAANVDLESRNFNIQQTSIPPGEAAASAGQIASLVRRSGPSYVTLVVSQPTSSDTASKETRKGTPVTSGSGFVVDGTGYVMTAAHVGKRIGNTVSARAANGRVYSGYVIAITPDNDMAVIRLRGFSGKAVTPANSQCLSKGSMVYSLGRPHAQGDTARLGEFLSPQYGKSVQYESEPNFGYLDAMVLRLSTQKGESGGPLFNETGELVGMVVSTLTIDGQPLERAHALPSRSLAGFLCSNMPCSEEWRAVAAGGGRCDY
ncbi:S1 family peptidase [Aestuariivirga sp.]|uniref:S1 family peptidase n=1 Tax=Aestuariivirga sp. TaxID=2650926 RepID=UPI003BAD66FA